ncbi:MAG TPA: coenzyme F420-0:L-glutamate ligase [Candidatus Limnocylindrales bacterium]|nr:coenzyme F420-0:L-glutamate ligase [Candidatus Limnocylindrales bacterium]
MVPLAVIAVAGVPEVRPGDDVAALVLDALARSGERLAPGDVVAVAQKVVSKAEGRMLPLDAFEPSARARDMAAESGKDARVIEAVLRESAEIVRWDRGVLIARTRHGFVCANAGVDRSNAGGLDQVVLLPVDPDASAERLRAALHAGSGADVGVVVTDTFGRPWREGQVNVAIGIAGVPPFRSHVGESDPHGYELRVTEIAIADEIASAAELVMGKLDRCPAAIVRGLSLAGEPGGARAYVRPREQDLFT